MTTVLLCLAAALLCWPGRPVRLPGRQADAPARPDAPGGWGRTLLIGGVAAAAVLLVWPGAVAVAVTAGVAAAGAGRWEARRRAARPGEGREDVAVLCDLWAAALDSGLPVGGALTAVLEVLDRPGAMGPTGQRLVQMAALLRVGADVDRAWRPADGDPLLAPLSAAARRSDRAGADLADAVREQARAARRAAAGVDERRAQRAGVLMTAPLTLCFLPAFICLGLAPVVIALIGTLDLGR